MKKNTPTIPYFTLRRQIKRFKPELDREIQKVFESGQFILGPVVENFEKNFAKYCGVKYAVGVASGTDALILAFRALQIGKNDEVIVPSYTYSATVFGILHQGAKPVFADIDLKTLIVSIDSIKKLITKKTKAILPVHLYGQPANMDELMKIARKFKLKIVEDVAQAHGATWAGKKTGSFGDFGCFSFYPTKNLGGFGDGGMIATNHPGLYKKILTLRNLGHINFRDDHQEVGWTSRLDALQAACLNVKLKYLDELNEKRRKIASHYRSRLKNTPLLFSEEGPQSRHVYHLLVVRVPHGKRDALQAHLAKEGITALIHYKTPFHRQPAYKKISKLHWTLPNTDEASKQILSLPIFPEMTFSEVDAVTQSINKFYQVSA